MEIARNSLIIATLPLWILFAYLQKPLIIGREALENPTSIISSKNALGMIGGYIASKNRHRKVLYAFIQGGTLLAVIIVGYVTSQINTIWLT